MPDRPVGCVFPGQATRWALLEPRADLYNPPALAATLLFLLAPMFARIARFLGISHSRRRRLS